MRGSTLSPELSVTWQLATQTRRVMLLGMLVGLASLAFAWLVLRAGFVSVVPLIVWGVVVAVIWRPVTALYIAFGLVSLFELNVEDPFMVPGVYIHYGLQHTLGLSGVIVSPLEMLLLMAMLVWLVQGMLGSGLDYRGGSAGKLVLVYSLFLVGGMIRGRVSGGDLYIGFWELRPILMLLVSYVLAANLIRTRLHVRLLVTSGFIGMGIFAIQGAYRRVALIDTGIITSHMEAWYGHDTVIFLACIVLLVIAQQVFGATWWQTALGLPALPLAVFTMLATERRAGQMALMIALLALFLVFFFVRRKAFYFIALPVLISGAIYLPLFWNASGVLAQPARAIRSISDPDPRDAASNLSREMEKINLRATIRTYPLHGVGFGQPFLQVVSIPDISFFPFWNFEPHHNLFWIWLKTGFFGYIIFWTLLGTSLARAAHLAKVLHDPELKIFAILAVGGIVSTLVFCYVDLGLTMGRVNVLLGFLIGVTAVLDKIAREDPPPQRRLLGR